MQLTTGTFCLSHDNHSASTCSHPSRVRETILAGDSPYLEEAHFYLAKALLAEGDAVGARAELNKTVAMAGDLAPQASALAARIP